MAIPAIAFASSAFAEMPADTMRQFGLVGAWSTDCSDKNAFRLTVENARIRLIVGPGQGEVELAVDEAIRPSPNGINLRGSATIPKGGDVQTLPVAGPMGMYFEKVEELMVMFMHGDVVATFRKCGD